MKPPIFRGRIFRSTDAEERCDHMSGFYQETEGIYRLSIPFERIYTSVFLITTEEGSALVDCGTTDSDVDNHIVPCLYEMGYHLHDIKFLVLTHRHGDHSGGLERILNIAPDIKVVTDVCDLFREVSTYPLAGHTDDSIGVFDGRTGTLISGDGLQGAGVDKYRCNTNYPEAYLKTLDRIDKDEKIKNILFSHAYEPWNSDAVFGREKVRECLKQCSTYVKR